MNKIIARLKGGLGNQLFQYAYGLALANQHAATLLLDVSSYKKSRLAPHGPLREFALTPFLLEYEIAQEKDLRFLHWFSALDRVPPYGQAIKRHIRNNFFEFRLERGFQFSLYAPLAARLAYVDGYWQSPAYFAGVEEKLLGMLALRNQPSQKTDDLLQEIESSNSLCVNVRRGDFALNGGNNFHGLVSKEYYESAAKTIMRRNDISKVYIFSDEPEWCSQNLRLDKRQVVVPHEFAGEHFSAYLHLMSKCSFFVIPNSTFGWWAVWLAGLRAQAVVAPENWFRNPNIVTSDLIPKNWARMGG